MLVLTSKVAAEWKVTGPEWRRLRVLPHPLLLGEPLLLSPLFGPPVLEPDLGNEEVYS